MAEIAAILEKSIHTLYKYSSNIRKNLNIHESDSVVDFIDEKLKSS
jgi:DNA-binding CsgD family transcriptional regulator